MQTRRLLIIVAVFSVVVVGALLGLAFWVLGPTQEASGPLVAATLPSTQTPRRAATASLVVVPFTDTPRAADPATPSAENTAPAPNGFTIFSIVAAESEAAFNIFEELRGAPKDVIGVTKQVAGEIGFDPAEVSGAQVGAITINARTLATDDDRRNQAIRNRILFTDQYEFITFTPTEVRGLSGSAPVGQPLTFQIAGDLTIRGVTQPVVFEVTAQLESPTRLSGQATTTIQRTPYNIVIPSVPFIANVGEDIALTLRFVAEQK